MSAHESVRLASILPELYSIRTVDSFLEHSLVVLERVIPTDQSLWLGYTPEQPLRLTTCVGRSAALFLQVADRVVAGMPSHPFSRYYATSAKRTALMSSDFSPEEWQAHRDAFDDVYRLVRLSHLLGIPVHDERGLLTLNLVREHHPFTEDDRAALNWLHPHLEQSLRNALVWSLATSDSAVRVQALVDVLRLSAREAEVAFWLSQGKTNHEIGLILDVARRTVEKHIERVLKSLRVENRTTAALAVNAALRDIAARQANGAERSDRWRIFAPTRDGDT